MKKNFIVGTKVFSTGTLHRRSDVWVTVRVEGANGHQRLSISGVEGPMPNGDAAGGAGQIVDDLCTGLKPREGFDVKRLVEVWKRWHLNDMRAGCVHQREKYDTSKRIEVVTYRLTSAALMARREIERYLVNFLTGGASVQLTSEQQALMNLPYERHTAPDADGAGNGAYEVSKREMRDIGQTYPYEHPEGILCKPCEVCGYKYGSSWLYEPLPADVLAYVESLPSDTGFPWRG